jgi:hypothetical protein
MSALTFSSVAFNANKIMQNQQLLQQHMWKTKPCNFGVNCTRELSECAGAHFLEEYRVPVCLFLHMCNKKDCTMYHPNLGSGQQYITFMEIDKALPSHEKWLTLKTQRDIVIKGAKHTISNSDLLRAHLMKTRPCFHGVKCKNKECSGAHFLDEYRLPICLYLEFCHENSCKAFHPHLAKTKEQFMQENNINLPIRKVRQDRGDMLPLRERNTQADIKHVAHIKSNTALCSYVKADSKCKKSGCSFAHSVDDLVLPFPVGEVSIEAKRVMAEQFMKKKIPDFFMNPSHMNSEYLGMMKKQIDLVDDLRRQEETGQEMQMLEMTEMTEEDESNIEEILQEIEQNKAKEEFLTELEMLFDLEEFHFSPEDEVGDEVDDGKYDDEDEDELKVKIVANSISQICKMEDKKKWEETKKEKGEALWGDDETW